MLSGIGLDILSKLLGSKLGRYIAGGLLVAVMVGMVLWQVFQAGRNKEKVNAQLRNVENLRTKIEVDKELQAMPPDARRDALRKWVRDD